MASDRQGINRTIRRTVVIGLGGTGVQSVLQMKKHFVQNDGAVPDAVQCFCVDTDRYKGKDKSLPETRDGQLIDLEKDEWLHAQVTDPRIWLSKEHVSKELPAEKINYKQLMRGAGCVRACGRMAVFAHANAISKMIKRMIDNVRSLSVREGTFEEGFDVVGADVTCYVVCSLAGGTGAGTFLDVAYMARSFLRSSDTLVGVFLLPDVFKTKDTIQDKDLLDENAYAALRELEYLTREGMRPGHHAKDEVEYVNVARTDWAAAPPFDRVHLIDNKTESGETVGSLEDVIEFIGRSLLINTGDVAGTFETVYDNARGVGYIGMGTAAIELPVDVIADRAILEKAIGVINDGFLMLDTSELGGDEDTVQAVLREDVRNFMLSSLLAEHNADCVTDYFLPPSACIEPTKAPDPWSSSEPHEVIGDWVKSERAAIESAYPSLADDLMVDGKMQQGGKQPRKLADACSHIEARLDDILHTKSGAVAYARRFLEILVKSLRSDRQEMIDEAAAKRVELRAAQEAYYSERDLYKNTHGLFPRSRIVATVEKYGRQLGRESRLMLEIVRRERAEAFYTALVRHIEDVLVPRVDRIQRNLTRVASDLGDEYASKEWAKSSFKFAELLPLDSLKPEVEALDNEVKFKTLLDMLVKDGLRIMSWGDSETKPSTISERLLGVIEERYQGLRKKGIEVVLDRMQKVELESLLDRELAAKASALWFLADPESETPLTTQVILGVPNRNNCMLMDGDRIDLYGGSGFPTGATEFASTNNHREISAFKYVFYARAHQIEGMEALRDSYYDSEGGDQTHHIRRAWARDPEVLGKVWPVVTVSGTEEQTLYWTLASAPVIDRIVVSGTHWGIRSRILGGEAHADNIVKLGHGRLHAFETFVNEARSKRLVQEIMDAVQEKTDELTKEHVGNRLREYYDELVAAASKASSPELLSQYKAEYCALAKYLRKEHGRTDVELCPEE